MARTTVLGAVLFSALAASSAAQSVYVDFGPPGSAYGVPPSTYGAAGPPGVWQGVSTASTSNLIDTSGLVTAVGLTVSAPPMLDACGHAATTGDDEALFDDRWFFDPSSVTLTMTGLAPGTYRVHVYVLVASCVDMFSPLYVTIAGATPVTDYASAFGWSGQAIDGQHYTKHYKSLASGENLVIETSAPIGFLSYTQHCGLQIIRVDPPAPFCFGDGSGTPCPCGNVGTAGRGCDNSFATGGALLRITFGGLPSVAHDSVELNVSGLPPTAPGLYFQGTAMVGGGLGATFGDGLRCVGGSVIRLGTKVSSGGASAYPEPGDPSVSVRGQIPPGGGTRSYQVWYRNVAAFCSPELFNLSNGLELFWGP